MNHASAGNAPGLPSATLAPYRLSKTYTAGSETFSEVVLRPPTFADYCQIGPAYDVQRGLLLPDREAIFAYVDRLVQAPAAGALAVLTIEDTMGLEEHVPRFFRQCPALAAQADELVFRLEWEPGYVDRLTPSEIARWFQRAAAWHAAEVRRRRLTQRHPG